MKKKLANEQTKEIIKQAEELERWLLLDDHFPLDEFYNYLRKNTGEDCRLEATNKAEGVFQGFINDFKHPCPECHSDMEEELYNQWECTSCGYAEVDE